MDPKDYSVTHTSIYQCLRGIAHIDISAKKTKANALSRALISVH